MNTNKIKKNLLVDILEKNIIVNLYTLLSIFMLAMGIIFGEISLMYGLLMIIIGVAYFRVALKYNDLEKQDQYILNLVKKTYKDATKKTPKR